MNQNRLFLALLATGTLATSVATAQAAPITTLFTTGSTVAEGAIDPNWTLTGTIPGGYASSLTVPTTGPFPLDGAWLANNATSKWLVPNGQQANHVANSIYNFTTTFNLTGFVPSSAELVFRFAVDNDLNNVLLNGNPLAVSGSGFTAFSANSTINNTTNPGVFQNGINTLTFVVNNGPTTTGNPVGLRVEIAGTAVIIPEANALSLLGFALPVVGMVIARRRK